MCQPPGGDVLVIVSKMARLLEEGEQCYFLPSTYNGRLICMFHLWEIRHHHPETEICFPPASPSFYSSFLFLECLSFNALAVFVANAISIAS